MTTTRTGTLLVKNCLKYVLKMKRNGSKQMLNEKLNWLNFIKILMQKKRNSTKFFSLQVFQIQIDLGTHVRNPLRPVVWQLVEPPILTQFHTTLKVLNKNRIVLKGLRTKIF